MELGTWCATAAASLRGLPQTRGCKINTVTELVRSLAPLNRVTAESFVSALLRSDRVQQALSSAGVPAEDVIAIAVELRDESVVGARLRRDAESAAYQLGPLAPAPTLKSKMTDLALEFVSLLGNPEFAKAFVAQPATDRAAGRLPAVTPLRSMPSLSAEVFAVLVDRLDLEDQRRGGIIRAIEDLRTS